MWSRGLRRVLVAWTCAVGAVSAQSLPGSATAPAAEPAAPSLPDGNELVRSMVDRQRSFEKELDRYTYDVLVTQDDLDGQGRVKQRHARRYEVMFVGHRQVRKLVEEDGRPLTAERLEKEERRAREEAEKAARSATPNEKDEEQAALRISEILRRFDFVSEARESLDGHTAIRIAFRALPGKRHLKHDEVLRTLQGRFWIDEEQRAVRRAALSNTQSIKFGAGLLASISRLDVTLEFVPVDDIWLPRRAESSVFGRILLLKGLRRRVTEEFLNYRRFEVDTQEQLADPSR